MGYNLLEDILIKEKAVMDSLQEWNEEEARKYSDKSHVLFMNNPDLCKPTSKLFAFHLLNRFAVFWNNSEFDKCKEILAQLDKMPLTGSELILKLCNAAELEFMLANYPKALSLIEKAMQLSPTGDEKYKLLLLKGKVEHEISGIPFEVNSFSEALGIAESLGNQEFIAEIYCELYTMFYSRYPGLAIYFLRKAEVLYTNLKDIHNLKTTQLKIALTLQSIYDRLGPVKGECFKRNADAILKSVEGHVFVMPSHAAYYNRIRGIVLKDVASIEKAFEYYIERGQNEGEINRTLQMMLDVFIYTKNHQKVKEYMPLCKKYFPSELHDELDDIEYRLSHNIPANRFQEFDERRPEDPFTLLDVLDQIALYEERCFENQLHIFSDYNREGKFETKMMTDGKISLIPCGLSYNNYYRGEREYHAIGKPSLYRKNMTVAKQFVERVKYEELCLLMEKYPLVQYYQNGVNFKFADGTKKTYELSIDKMALAQHYGICTELMDFTVDKFVAAFFACTKYNEDDTYSVNDEEGGDGCFYHYVDKNVHSGMAQLRAVGLQPFSRPGEQAGYVLQMNADENLNDCVANAIHFKHNRKVSEFIFNYTNRSKKLFPKSILDDKAMIIKNSNVFSKKAYEMAKKEYYSDISDDVLMGYLKDENKTLCETPIVAFSSQEIEDFHKEWKECGQYKFLSKVIVSEETIN